MHIIARPMLIAFASKYPDAKQALDAWWAEAKSATWRGPADVKERYGSASILADNRVVFNVRGGNYRLVVRINYHSGTVFIRYVGTHAEYDRIDAEAI